MDWISVCILLLLVIDPIGNIFFTVSVLKGLEPKRRRWVILRECGIALLVLLTFLTIGDSILNLLGLSQSSLGIAGGIILFLIALRMVFGFSESVTGKPLQEEPLIVPLAIPLMAGPAALATVILLTSHYPTSPGTLALGLIVAMTINTILLLLGERIAEFVGPRGLQAFERLMGLILTALAVQMFLEGLREFLRSPH